VKVALYPKSRRTHCLRGHPFLPETTYTAPDGSRNCRICRAERESKTTPRRVTCPDCGVRRRVYRPVRPDRRFADGVCQPCANVRVADFERAVSIVVTDELKDWWLERYTIAEIVALAAELAPLELSYLDAELAAATYQREAA
jgi:rubredoxin